MRLNTSQRALRLGGGGALLMSSLLLLFGVASAAHGDDDDGSGATSTASPSASATVDDQCGSTISYSTFNATDKVTANAFGPEVTARSRSGILDGLEAYACKQPAGARALVADVVDYSHSNLNSGAKKYVDERDTWRSDVAKMMDKLRSDDTQFHIKHDVPVGTSSLYMEHQSGDVHVSVQPGHTSHTSTAAVFTFSDGHMVWILLDCHYQPAWKSTGSSPAPTHTPASTPSSSPSPKPSKSLTPKDSSAKDYYQLNGNGKGADTGTKTKKKVSTSSSGRSTPGSVQKGSSGSSSSSSSSSSDTSAGSSSSAGSGSSDSSSGQSTTDQSAPNEGGDASNGGNPGKP